MKNSLLVSLSVIIVNSLIAQNPCATKMVLMEQSCAKNCGPCYFHIRDYTNPLYAAHKNQIAMVVYNQAPIGVGSWSEQNKPYYAFGSIFNLEYQSMVMIDRTFFPNNYMLQQGPTSEGVESEAIAFNNQINSINVPVSVNITNTYNSTTRAVNINVTANFCDIASGDLRIYAVLTQDTVKGPAGESYGQNVNASNGVLDGYNVVTYPNSIGNWAESYAFINPVKYQPSGFFGNAGIIPANPVIGNNYTENFSFTLPLKNSTTEAMNIEPNRIQIVAAVVKNGAFQNREVLNANKKYLVTPAVGIQENSLSNLQFNVLNPIGNTLFLNYSSTTNGVGHIYVYNSVGQIIKTLNNLEYNTSVSKATIDVSDLSNGIYFVSFKAEGIFHTRKIVISK